MKKLSLVLVLFATSILLSQMKEIPIVPSPQKIEFQKGNFKIEKDIKIGYGGKENQYAAELISKTLNEFLNINSSLNENREGDITFIINEKVKPETGSNSEGYILDISDEKIVITSSEPKGIFYGAVSLIQLLEKTENKELPSVKITDWPDLKVRGVSDDISRGQVSTIENFKKIISQLARYKMNTYMPYLEDMLVFNSYPTIGVNRGALSKDEVKEIIEFAEKHFIEVIPIFQTLGHYENILSQDEFLKFAEFPGAASLNVSSDSVYLFIENMLKEVFEIFPSEYFHMGADESYDVGLGYSKHLVDKTDIATVHANHYKKVYNICKKYNKKVLMYGDIILQHPEILSQIPKDIIVVDWHYRGTEGYSSTKKFKEAGFDYYVSPSVWNFQTAFPTNVNAIPNIQYIIKSGLENNSSGMINSNWGDYGAETFRELIYYGYAWSAQCSWNYDDSDLNRFAENYFYDFFGVNDSRLTDIYNQLSNPLNQMHWHEIFRHPLLDFREPAWWVAKTSPVVKISWMEWSLPQVSKKIHEVKNLVKKNADHLDMLEFILNLSNWYKFKLQTQIELKNENNFLTGSSKESMIEMINKNVSELEKLKKEFSNLWKRYYKKENLFMVQDKFDRLKFYFNEISGIISRNEFISDDQNTMLASPLIQSKWIYVKTNDTSYAVNAEFKKEFTLDEIPDEAYLQLIADTYAKLYINGEYVEQVYARRSLSLLVDYKRIKLIDIKKYLKQGNNVILTVVENYNRNGASGINIISQLKSGNEIININTDSSSGWKAKYKSSDWKNVSERNYPFLITAPNFETKRTSWIER